MSIKCACGNQTNEADGVCRICKLFRNNEIAALPSVARNDNPSPVIAKSGATKQSQIKGGVKMATTGVKRCKHCGNEYKPTSNAQKKCTDCGAKLNLEKTKKRKRDKTTPLNPPLSKGEFKVSRKGKLYIAPSPVIAKEEKQSQFIDIIKNSLRNEVGPVIENIKNELKKLEGMIA